MSDRCRFRIVRRLLRLALGSSLLITGWSAWDREAAGQGLGTNAPADDTGGPGFAKGHALVVAIANYQHVSRLPPAVLDDGRDIYDLLDSQKYCGYRPENVTLLLDDQATTSNISEALKALARDTKPEDTVVVFFSGHGGRFGPKGAEKTFLLPVDFDPDRAEATGLGSDEFSMLLGKIKAERLVVLLDACHAAGAGDLKAVVPVAGVKLGLGNEAYDALATGRGRVIVASCLEDEFSVVVPGARNSLFTQKLLEALRGSAGSTGDGTIRILSIFRYLSLMVPKFNEGQHPLLRTYLQDDFAVALFLGGSKDFANGPSLPKPGARDTFPVALAGPDKVALMARLVDRWPTLAVYLEIPLSDQRKFPQGGEPKALIDWLEQRDQLWRLKPAFEALRYNDLIKYISNIERNDPKFPPKALEPKTLDDQARLDMMRKITNLLEHGLGGTRPGLVVQNIQNVLNGIDKNQLERLLDGEVSESKNLLRYCIANALDVVADASLNLFQYQEALSAYREQYRFLEPIYAANPRWQPLRLPTSLSGRPIQPEGVPDQMQPASPLSTPIAVLVFLNRLDYCSTLHASLESRIDDATRIEIRSALGIAADVSRQINAPKMVRFEMSSKICMSYYMNNDLALARNVLGQALVDYGTLPPDNLMGDEDRLFVSMHHLLLSSVLAEQGDTASAVRMIRSAKPFANNLFDDRGMVGHDYLLIARASKDPKVIASAVENAVQELDNNQSDVSCRYNLACALSKRCQGETAVEKERDLGRAVDLLLSVIDTLKTGPLEPQIDAIGRDPFLKPVVERAEVREALDNFRWNPLLLRPPVLMPELWHHGVPLKRFRFTRLNGDIRD